MGQGSVLNARRGIIYQLRTTLSWGPAYSIVSQSVFGDADLSRVCPREGVFGELPAKEYRVRVPAHDVTSGAPRGTETGWPVKRRKAILLAAGMGTRLRALTDDRPKPMVYIGDMPLLEYNVCRLARYGFTDIGINLHHYPDVVRNHFADGSRQGVSIVYSYEPTLLGTAGAIKALESFVDGHRVLVHYGDNLTTCDLDAFDVFHRDRGGIASIALFAKEDVTPHSAVDVTASGRITRFVEKPKPGQTSSRWISAGVLLLEPRILDYIPAGEPYDFGFDLFPRLLAAGERLFGYSMGDNEGLWWIDTPQDYARVSQLAAAGLF